MITRTNPTARFTHPRCFWHPHRIWWPWTYVQIEGRTGTWRLQLLARPLRRWSYLHNRWLWALPGTVEIGTRNRVKLGVML